MYHDTIKFAENCPQCAIATGSSWSNKPPLHPVVTNRTINSIIINFIIFSINLNNNKHHCKYNILILIISCITLVLLSLFLVPLCFYWFCGLIKEKEDNKLLQPNTC